MKLVQGDTLYRHIMIALLAREWRLCLMLRSEQTLLWDMSDRIFPEEIPDSGTFSGWMRTQAEAHALDHPGHRLCK